MKLLLTAWILLMALHSNASSNISKSKNTNSKLKQKETKRILLNTLSKEEQAAIADKAIEMAKKDLKIQEKKEENLKAKSKK